METVMHWLYRVVLLVALTGLASVGCGDAGLGEGNRTPDPATPFVVLSGPTEAKVKAQVELQTKTNVESPVYQWWVKNAPETSALQKDESLDGSRAQLSFSPDVEGSYTIGVRVQENVEDSWTFTATPVDSAQVDPTLELNAVSEPSGTGLLAMWLAETNAEQPEFIWKVESAPEGSTHQDRSEQNDVEVWSLILDVAGEYKVSVALASHPHLSAMASVTVAPWIDASLSQNSVETGESIELQATTNIHSPQWQWEIVSAPEGSQASIGNAQQENATFTPDIAGEYSLQVQADDLTSAPLTLSAVDGLKALPVQMIVVNGQGHSASGVYKGDPHMEFIADVLPSEPNVTYTFEIIGRPDGSTAPLQNTGGLEVKVVEWTADALGEYTVRVQASTHDGFGQATATFVVDEIWSELYIPSPTSGTVLNMRPAQAECMDFAFDGLGNPTLAVYRNNAGFPPEEGGSDVDDKRFEIRRWNGVRWSIPLGGARGGSIIDMDNAAEIIVACHLAVGPDGALWIGYTDSKYNPEPGYNFRVERYNEQSNKWHHVGGKFFSVVNGMVTTFSSALTVTKDPYEEEEEGAAYLSFLRVVSSDEAGYSFLAYKNQWRDALEQFGVIQNAAQESNAVFWPNGRVWNTKMAAGIDGLPIMAFVEDHTENYRLHVLRKRWNIAAGEHIWNEFSSPNTLDRTLPEISGGEDLDLAVDPVDGTVYIAYPDRADTEIPKILYYDESDYTWKALQPRGIDRVKRVSMDVSQDGDVYLASQKNDGRIFIDKVTESGYTQLGGGPLTTSGKDPVLRVGPAGDVHVAYKNSADEDRVHVMRLSTIAIP